MLVGSVSRSFMLSVGPSCLSIQLVGSATVGYISRVSRSSPSFQSVDRSCESVVSISRVDQSMSISRVDQSCRSVMSISRVDQSVPSVSPSCQSVGPHVNRSCQSI